MDYLSVEQALQALVCEVDAQLLQAEPATHIQHLDKTEVLHTGAHAKVDNSLQKKTNK
jgi:hypothetical protein